MENNISIYEQWIKSAYDRSKSLNEQELFWKEYTKKEKNIYIKLLNIREFPILGTFRYFANLFEVDLITMMGFLYGINDYLKTPNKIETINENTLITLDYDAEKLYKSLSDNGFNELCNLNVWDDIIPNKTSQMYQEYQVNNASGVYHSNKPTCPTCGSTNLKKISTASKAANTVFWGLLGTKRFKTFHCNNCGYEW